MVGFGCGLRGGSILCALLLCPGSGAASHQQDAFTVHRPAQAAGPRITSYLRYQVDKAWDQDEMRLAVLRGVRNESDLLSLQGELRKKLLQMIGGLPEQKTPLNARITGKIQLAGYRIEKVIFESLPGFHVSALLYVPDAPATPKPAVLVPCGHSTN